jgi:hypothetical protein
MRGFGPLNNVLGLTHCMIGRKSQGWLLAVGHHASWHPKETIIVAKKRLSEWGKPKKKH